jgi:predicted DsbA family dithiol-disulfide isomerase
MSVRLIKLTVINDLVCPYCYIGYRELQDAISACKDLNLPLEFNVEYRPFRLMNCLPDNKSVDKGTFYLQKLGQERFEAMRDMLVKWGEEKGEKVAFGGVVSQTTYAHRLSRKAFKMGGQDLQLPLLGAIFRAYCAEEKDIGDIQILAELAESVSLMDKDEAVRFLESDELKDEVQKLADEARAKGISGIPVTVIDNKWAVSGGKSADVYVQIFKKMAACSGQASKSPVPGAYVPEIACQACA